MRYQCSLNGKALSDIHPDLVITDIREESPEINTVTQEYPMRPGMRLVRMLRRSLNVIVEFAIYDQEIQRRKEICQIVQKWARDGGVLRINDRPGQQLNVVCTEVPTIASALKWTGSLRTVFTAFSYPFWEGSTSTVASIVSSGNVSVPGTAENARANAVVTNIGGVSISSVRIRSGETDIAFNGINIPTGGNLKVGYDENGYLFARIGNTSVLNKRTSTSTDDLMLHTGVVEVQLETNGSARMDISTKGAWL